MADGEINRNGATIRIDDDGGVQVEPAEGQEVEYTGPDRGTDAIRDSVETDKISTDQIGAAAQKDSDQTIPNDTRTQVSIEDNLYEDEDVVSVDLDNDQFVIQEDGTYVCHVRLLWSADSSWSEGDTIAVRINMDGVVDILRSQAHGGFSSNRESVQVESRPVDLASGDTVQIDVEQVSGESQDIENLNLRNLIKVVRIG